MGTVRVGRLAAPQFPASFETAQGGPVVGADPPRSQPPAAHAPPGAPAEHIEGGVMPGEPRLAHVRCAGREYHGLGSRHAQHHRHPSVAVALLDSHSRSGLLISTVVAQEERRLGSLFEELEAREAAARTRVEVLEAKLAEVSRRLMRPVRGWNGCRSGGRRSPKCWGRRSRRSRGARSIPTGRARVGRWRRRSSLETNRTHSDMRPDRCAGQRRRGRLRDRCATTSRRR
ncbi:hypothetical protein EDD90_10366 [Streptomyces sp. Ag109_O5-1]|nr:hypothetical protein EDD90_10366 [Streptomyces sp. Ag109_O5-1]